MLIADPLLPAAVHLTGDGAPDVLRPAVHASGGRLVDCHTSQVQYRPASDLVVRYRCRIERNGSTTDDTVLAGTTTNGIPTGTLPVEAVSPSGEHLRVGVWRWPFDPVLSALETMVTPHLAVQHLAGLVGGRPSLEVVAYRPTERAVVRATGDGRSIYLKVVAPAAVDGLVTRHQTLAAAGLPVPRVEAAGTGWIAMGALEGTTLRDRLKAGRSEHPPAHAYRELIDTMSTVDLGGLPPVRSRLDDAPHHAAILAAVEPSLRTRLDDLIGRLRASAPAPTLATAHGDLHESQLVVDDERIIGLLDIDDAGPGDPLDDAGTLLAHLRFRALTADDPSIDAVADGIRSSMCRRFAPADLDHRVAGVLIGLATGPFRLQHEAWRRTTDAVVELAERHLEAAT
ncbi:MAG: phosphotransferase [Ilumatobacter fluminis]|uniref:phosphotransferase family protein n=1 Tax=Ilumatobacter fluminis TaxID=467091 RepID=UPI0032EBA2FE